MAPVTLVADNNTNGYAVTRRTIETCDQAAQTETPYDVFNVKRAEQVVEALSVTVQYLAYGLDAFSTPKLKKNYENMKTEWLTACAEVDELRARHVSMEERLDTERKDHRRALDQLREDLENHHTEQITALEANLQKETEKWELRLVEATKEHRAVIARLRAEHEAALTQRDSEAKRRLVHDQGAALAAEVESFRAVLELKSQENTSLRSELDVIRREIEGKDILQQKVDMLEARCEDLKAQLQSKELMERQISHNNEMLHESLHQISKQNKRLLQRNEELQWRLRQKNEVVSVLANQLTSPRLTRSLGSENIDHSMSIDKSNPQQSNSMIKFVIEKSDSVSWTLDLDKTHLPLSSAPPKLLTHSTQEGSLAAVSRQGSLRLTPRRTGIDTRARSKSISVTDSARVEDSGSWPFTSTPINTRRRPRSDPSSSSTSSSSSSSTTSSSSAHAVAAAAAAAVAAEDGSTSQTPQEAGGEAMISEETSASSSEDESSTSSDIPRLPMQFAWGKPIN